MAPQRVTGIDPCGVNVELDRGVMEGKEPVGLRHIPLGD